MSGKWESLAVAAVLSASLNANAMENNNIERDDSPTKIETVSEYSDNLISDDMSMAWQVVPSREDLARDMKSDGEKLNDAMETLSDVARVGMHAARAMEGDPIAIGQVTEDVLEIGSVEEELEKHKVKGDSYSADECMYLSLLNCMATQQSNPTRISQKYGATREEYNKMKEEGKDNLYGGFLEYLSLTGDKELAKALGLPEEGVTPEVLNLVLANAPEIPYEKQEELYNKAKEDGRLNDYLEYGKVTFSKTAKYEKSQYEAGVSWQDAAKINFADFDNIKDMQNILIARYGENAKGLMLRAFASDGELAKSFGYKEGEFSPQELLVSLAYRQELPKETVDKMVTPQDNELADKVFDMIVNKEVKAFTFDSENQKSVSNIQSVIAQVNKREISEPAQKLSLELAEVHPQTKVNANAMLMASIRESR